MKKDSIQIYANLDETLLQHNIHSLEFDNSMLYKYLGELVIFDFASEIGESYLYRKMNNDIQFLVNDDLHHVHYN